MIRIVTIFVMVVVLSAFAFGQNYIYVLNSIAETLSRINIETGQVDDHIVTLGSVPNQVIYYDGFLYVVNSFSPSLMVIDPVTNTVISEIAMPVNSNPWNVEVYGQFAYVTGLATNSVYKVSLAQESVVATWETGVSPEGVIAYDGYLYVTNTGFNPIDYSYGQGSISIFDLGSGDEVDRIDVGINPQNVAIGPDGLLNVICTGDYVSHVGMIYFVDLWQMLVTDSLTLGGTPTVPAVHNSGVVFVAAGGWSDDGYVYSYNATTRTVLHDSSNPLTMDTGVMGLAVDAMGTLYAGCQLANTVNAFSPNGTVEETFNVGSGPSSMAVIDTRVDIDDIVELPGAVKLGLPYPNPFNATAIIPVNGQVDKGAEIEIYDITGRLVNRLSLTDDGSINYSVSWSGIDISGSEVASGVYFARLAGTARAVKMVLLR